MTDDSLKDFYEKIIADKEITRTSKSLSDALFTLKTDVAKLIEVNFHFQTFSFKNHKDFKYLLTLLEIESCFRAKASKK